MSKVKLNEVTTIIMGQSPSSDSYNEVGEGVPFYQGKSDFGDLHPTPRIYCNEPKKIAEPYDILMSVRAPVGDVNIANTKCCIGRGICAIRSNEQVNYKYIYYYLRTIKCKLESMSTGSTFKAINKSVLDSIELQIPSLEEQEIIVSILERAEGAISKREECIRLLDELVKSRFIEMFGDISRNTKEWDIIKLDELIDVVGGYAFKSTEFVDEGIPVLKIGNINAGYFKPTNLMFWNKEEKLDRYLIKPNDLVISLTGTVGKDDYGNVCIMSNDYNEYYLNQRNAKLDIKNEDLLDKYYLTYALKVPEVKKRLTGISRGVRQANIANKDIQNLEIPIPTIELQKQFTDFVKQVDKLKFEMESSLEELQNNFNSLMQRAFNGEL